MLNQKMTRNIIFKRSHNGSFKGTRNNQRQDVDGIIGSFDSILDEDQENKINQHRIMKSNKFKFSDFSDMVDNNHSDDKPISPTFSKNGNGISRKKMGWKNLSYSAYQKYSRNAGEHIISDTRTSPKIERQKNFSFYELLQSTYGMTNPLALNSIPITNQKNLTTDKKRRKKEISNDNGLDNKIFEKANNHSKHLKEREVNVQGKQNERQKQKEIRLFEKKSHNKNRNQQQTKTGITGITAATATTKRLKNNTSSTNYLNMSNYTDNRSEQCVRKNLHNKSNSNFSNISNTSNKSNRSNRSNWQKHQESESFYNLLGLGGWI